MNTLKLAIVLGFVSLNGLDALTQVIPAPPSRLRFDVFDVPTVQDQTVAVTAEKGVLVTLGAAFSNSFTLYLVSSPFVMWGGPSCGRLADGDVDWNTGKVLRNPLSYTSFRYRPSNVDMLEFIAVSGVKTSRIAKVVFNITPVNHAPTAKNVTDLAFAIRTGNGPVTKSYVFRGVDFDEDSLVFSASGLPTNATLNPSTGELLLRLSDSDIGKSYSGIRIGITDGVTNVSKTISIGIREPTNYYVSKGGLDSNSGTIAAPWLTIGRAVTSAMPGDTVFVGSGTYPERISTKANLNGSDYLTITTNGSGSVAVQGFQINGDYIAIGGFTITNPSPNVSAITIGGNNAKIYYNRIQNVAGKPAISADWYSRPQLAHIASNSIYRCQSGIYTFGFLWTIEYNEIERLFMWNSGYDCDYINLFGEGHQIRYNYFHGTIPAEIGSAHVDAFQTYDDYNSGYWAANCVMERNLCSEFHEGFEGEARYLHRSRNLIFRENVFFNGMPLGARRAGVSGIVVHDIPNVVVTNNTFYNITYGLVWDRKVYSLSTGAVVKNNIFYGQDQGYDFYDGTGDYNLVYPGTPSYTVGPHDLYGSAPSFINVGNPLGNDGKIWTGDDGFRLQSGSAGKTAGESGREIGAYGNTP